MDEDDHKEEEEGDGRGSKRRRMGPMGPREALSVLGPCLAPAMMCNLVERGGGVRGDARRCLG